MVTTNPDKYIRKAVFNLIDGITVAPYTIFCYDTRVPTNSTYNQYILLTSQTKDVLKPNKCEHQWETSLLIEIYTKSFATGNPGSRVLLNDIEQAVIDQLNTGVSVDGFDTIIQNVTFENQLETVTQNEIIFRSFLRLNLTLI